MKPAPFEYFEPTTLDEALSFLAKNQGETKILAGGQSLVPMMNFRLVTPAVLMDINSLHSLDYIRITDGWLAIGALTRHADVKASSVVAAHCPLMINAYQFVAHTAIRNRGTIGGNLSHADPSSELPAVMIAMGAELILQKQGGTRTVPAGDFFISTFTTALEPDEMLTEVRVPPRPRGEGSAFTEVSLRKGDFALVAVAASLRMRGGVCDWLRLVYTGVADRAIRVAAVEDAVLGTRATEQDLARAGNTARLELTPVENIHASADYRRDAAYALTVRALAAARDNALRGDG